MKKFKQILSGILLWSLCSTTLLAQQQSQWDYDLKVGIHIGGATPIPMPREIREIKGYDPTFTVPLEIMATRWLTDAPQWGVSFGLKAANQAMHTHARVKNYQTLIVGQDGASVSGYWTGHVETKYRATTLSLPVLLSFLAGDLWRLSAGLYASWSIRREFSGRVYEGYLREGTPIGQKSEFSGEHYSTYDFSEQLRAFAYGVRLGASRRVYRSWSVYTDLSAGLSPLFKRGFDTVTFPLYPIYASVGIGYGF